MTAHTPGPWEITCNESRIISIAGNDASDKIVAHIYFPGVDAVSRLQGHVELSDEDRANAARIVACVNACDGVSNDELAAIGIENGKAETLRAQRDELAAALRDVMNGMERVTIGGNFCLPEPSVMERARAALVKVSP